MRKFKTPKQTELPEPIKKHSPIFHNTLQEQMDELQKEEQLNLEIERKWLFTKDQFKDLDQTFGRKEYQYEQSYLSINPEIRIRKKQKIEHFYVIKEKATYKLCIKSKGSLVRKEIEKDLTEQEYKDLKGLMPVNSPIIKKHFIALQIKQQEKTYTLTVGIVDEGEPTTFCYGEIEFKSKTEANNFQAPEWFGLEITDDLSYKMANYYQRKGE